MVQVVIAEHGHFGSLLSALPDQGIFKDTLALARSHELVRAFGDGVDERSEA